MVSGCCYFVDLSFADWGYFGRNCDKCGDFGAGGWGLLGEGSFPGALGLGFMFVDLHCRLLVMMVL